MALAFLLSPNPESKFGVTGVEGFVHPLPKFHDIGKKTVEDKRFSSSDENRCPFGAAVHAAGTFHFGLLSAWELN